MHFRGNTNQRKTEARVMNSIRKNWNVDVSYIQDPNYGGQCLVDSSGLVVAWVRSYDRSDPEAELCIDIRHLLEVMPLMLANSKPLVIVVAYPDDVRYVLWRPGNKDFRRYETPFEDGWQATFLPHELSPVGPGLPTEIRLSSAAKPKTRKETALAKRHSRWRDVFEPPLTP